MYITAGSYQGTDYSIYLYGKHLYWNGSQNGNKERKMTNKQAYNCYTFLKNNSKNCKGKLGYAVARNIRKLGDELTEYIQQLNNLVIKYGKKDQNGSQYVSVNDPNYELILKEMKAFDELECNVEIMKVNQETLESSDLHADVMLGLMDFMVE